MTPRHGYQMQPTTPPTDATSPAPNAIKKAVNSATSPPPAFEFTTHIWFRVGFYELRENEFFREGARGWDMSQNDSVASLVGSVLG
jgi:hypothetical protein